MDDVLNMEIDEFCYEISELTECKEFQEFGRTVDELSDMNNEIQVYTEELVDRYSKLKKSQSAAWKNTKKTTGDMVKTWHGATKAASATMKVEWMVISKCWGLIGNALAFIGGVLDKIPEAVESISKRMHQIPHEIMAKVRGDIKLYFTVGDFKSLYGNGLIGRIERFIAAYRALTSNPEFQGKKGIAKYIPLVKGQDQRYVDNLLKIGKTIETLKFEPNIIRMDNNHNKELYFTSQNAASFTDNHGKSFSMSYLDGLKKIVEDLQNYKKDIQELRAIFGDKYNDAQVSEDFANLSTSQQLKIQYLMQATSKVIGDIGSIIKAIMTDIKTIEGTVKKIQSASSNNSNSEQSESNT